MTSEPESPRDDEDAPVESTEASTAATEAPVLDDARPGRTSSKFGSAKLLLPILLSLAVIGAMALAGSLYYLQYRPDRQLDGGAAHRAIQAASDGAVASVSYSTESMDRDFANAKAHLTGKFLTYYDTFTKQLVTPALRQSHITQTAEVVRAAVSELHPDSAVVLVFLNETTVNRDKPQPLITPTSMRITLTKVSGTWLISSLDPPA
jgi:Mce-associated membrane protein